MRIAHIISSLDASTGGPPIVAGSIASALSTRGHDVTIIGGVDVDQPASALESIPGISSVNIITYKKTDNRLLQLKGKHIQKILHQMDPFDVIHFHGVWCPELLELKNYLKYFDANLVVSVHGMLDSWSLKQSRILKFAALQLYVKNILSNASFLHALNAHEEKRIKIIAPNSNICVIGNGIFSKFVSDNRSDNVLQPNSGIYFLFLSRIHHKKGLDYLISSWEKAVKYLSSARLLIAGPGDPASIANLRNLIDTNKLNSTVEYIGPVYGPEKYEMIKNAHAFILPSRQEGFSMAILESLSQGTPVIISENCNFPEVKENSCGIVNKLDSTELSQSIIKLANDYKLRHGMSLNAIDLVKKHYTWELLSEKLEKEYIRYTQNN